MADYSALLIDEGSDRTTAAQHRVSEADRAVADVLAVMTEVSLSYRERPGGYFY